MRVLKETQPSEAEFRARAERIKSQISSSEMLLQQSWEPPGIEGGKPICRVDVRGRLKMPNYGAPGATCSCVVMLEWQDPDANAKPRNLGGAATMARYGGGGEGTYEAVIRMPRWEPGRYMAVLRINQREVDRKEFEIVPPS